jgi:hypothetical protein
VSLEIPSLVPWREIPELHDFAGTVEYRTEFNFSPSEKTRSVVLHLGEVYEAGRVRLNSEEVGDVWHYPYEIQVTDAVKPGRNTLEIAVPNILQNYEARAAPGYPRASRLLGPVTLTEH